MWETALRSLARWRDVGPKTFPSPPCTQLQYPQHVLAEKLIKQVFTVMNPREKKKTEGYFVEAKHPH